MSDLPQIFRYEGRQVRTILRDGEVWFVTADIATILDIANPSQALARLDDDEKVAIQGKESLLILTEDPNVTQMSLVNEPGLYSLILGSRKPEARAFKRWITHEVIPSIRKTGVYGAPATLEDLIIMQAQSVKELKAKVAAVEEKALTAHHRIDLLDAINTIGDPQQRLNAMVRKYAYREGLTFSKAWSDYIQSYNTAYRTNLKLLKINYELREGRKTTVPQYLAACGKLEDSLRVADRLLNPNTVTAQEG